MAFEKKTIAVVLGLIILAIIFEQTLDKYLASFASFVVFICAFFLLSSKSLNSKLIEKKVSETNVEPPKATENNSEPPKIVPDTPKVTTNEPNTSSQVENDKDYNRLLKSIKKKYEVQKADSV